MDVHKVANNCISGSYISIAGPATSRLYWCGSVPSLGGGLEGKNILFFVVNVHDEEQGVAAFGVPPQAWVNGALDGVDGE